MQRFHTKIDWWVIAFAIAFSGLLIQLLLTMYARGTLLDYALHSAVFSLAVVVLWWPILTTRYVIQNEQLIIRSLWFKWMIPLKDIRNISTSQDLQLAPALSLTRLKLNYIKEGQTHSILVSPRQVQRFKHALILKS